MDSSHPKMEASSATLEAPRTEPSRQRPPGSGARDPLRLGYRERLVTTPDGRAVWAQIPLTPEALVYPQAGDHVAQGLPHFSFLHPQADAMRRYLQKRPGIAVTSDVLVVLRHDGKTSAPDVAVIEGDFDTSEITGAIHLETVGGRLAFVLEAVSTSEKEIENKDLEKNLLRYAREGVEEYFTVYPVAGRRVENQVGRRLVAAKGHERNAAGSYVEIAPDAGERVLSEKLGLFFQIDAESEKLVVIDAETGERLLISDEEEAGRREAEAALEAAEERAGQAEGRADQAEQVLRRNVEDLCGLLGIEWTAERSTAVTGMGLAQLEALWADLLNQKRWP